MPLFFFSILLTDHAPNRWNLASRCNACPQPKAWTWTSHTSRFCTSSQDTCDSNSACGDRITTKSNCEAAAAELFQSNSTELTEIYDQDAPEGCFQDEQSRLYFHVRKMYPLRRHRAYSFIRSLCHWDTTGATNTPSPHLRTRVPMGLEIATTH